MNLKGIPESRGKTVYQQIQAGKAVCASAAIVAKCFECMSGYEDGRQDCEISACPLYRWMPYRKDKKIKKSIL